MSDWKPRSLLSLSFDERLEYFDGRPQNDVDYKLAFFNSDELKFFRIELRNFMKLKGYKNGDEIYKAFCSCFEAVVNFIENDKLGNYDFFKSHFYKKLYEKELQNDSDFLLPL